MEALLRVLSCRLLTVLGCKRHFWLLTGKNDFFLEHLLASLLSSSCLGFLLGGGGEGFAEGFGGVFGGAALFGGLGARVALGGAAALRLQGLQRVLLLGARLGGHSGGLRVQ